MRLALIKIHSILSHDTFLIHCLSLALLSIKLSLTLFTDFITFSHSKLAPSLTRIEFGCSASTFPFLSLKLFFNRVLLTFISFDMILTHFGACFLPFELRLLSSLPFFCLSRAFLRSHFKPRRNRKKSIKSKKRKSLMRYPIQFRHSLISSFSTCLSSELRMLTLHTGAESLQRQKKAFRSIIFNQTQRENY